MKKRRPGTGIEPLGKRTFLFTFRKGGCADGEGEGRKRREILKEAGSNLTEAKTRDS